MLGGVEWIAKPVLDRLGKGQPICDTDKQWFAAYVGLLRTRTASMRSTIIRTIEQELGNSGMPATGLVDRLDTRIQTPDGEDDLRTGAMLLMFNWGIKILGREFHGSEWWLQRVAKHELVITREPVSHLIQDQGAGDCMLLSLDHQTALFINTPGKPLVMTLRAGEINWLTTRFHDEVLWHPSRDQPLIEPPSWAGLVTEQRGHVPGTPLDEAVGNPTVVSEAR